MLDAAKPTLFRIIGPNSVGLMIPPLKLNAGFAHLAAKTGNIALLSQSGAIATSLIDWAADNNVGFSHIVSLGDMADVDVGDWLDLLAGERKTRAIVMYLETIPNARKFMSAARAAARIKPVIAIKAGRHEAAAKAAATHTGALSGADRVVDAALQRAGILRVNGLAELFDAVETTARFAPLDRARVGIVTNGGGAGVLAVDQLIDRRGELAELSTATIEKLNACAAPNLVACQSGRHHRRRAAGALSRRGRGGRCGRSDRRRVGAELPDGLSLPCRSGKGRGCPDQRRKGQREAGAKLSPASTWRCGT